MQISWRLCKSFNIKMEPLYSDLGIVCLRHCLFSAFNIWSLPTLWPSLINCTHLSFSVLVYHSPFQLLDGCWALCTESSSLTFSALGSNIIISVKNSFLSERPEVVALTTWQIFILHLTVPISLSCFVDFVILSSWNCLALLVVVCS